MVTHTAKHVVDNLNTLTGAYRLDEVTTDFIEYLFTLLRLDDVIVEHADTVDKYTTDSRSREAVDELLTEAALDVVTASHETGRDVIGEVYELAAQHRGKQEHLGQYFTPSGVTDLMSELTDESSTEPTESTDYDRGDMSADAIESRPWIGDLGGCGSGRLLLPKAFETPAGIFCGIDKDRICAKLAAINLALWNLDGQVIHGNALTCEYQSVFNVYHDEQCGGYILTSHPEDSLLMVPSRSHEDAEEPQADSAQHTDLDEANSVPSHAAQAFVDDWNTSQ
ncbi:N-6 DNA methylase [Halobaculum sp. MBLA0147]|uniref:N-6 DNA methylase n=1 Tax=Halobaculum sp. MBLA0147 TaxID=3079934 RepID=UPI003524E7E2